MIVRMSCFAPGWAWIFGSRPPPGSCSPWSRGAITFFFRGSASAVCPWSSASTAGSVRSGTGWSSHSRWSKGYTPFAPAFTAPKRSDSGKLAYRPCSACSFIMCIASSFEQIPGSNDSFGSSSCCLNWMSLTRCSLEQMHYCLLGFSNLKSAHFLRQTNLKILTPGVCFAACNASRILFWMSRTFRVPPCWPSCSYWAFETAASCSVPQEEYSG